MIARCVVALAALVAGSFAELGLGWALQRYGYEVKDVPADVVVVGNPARVIRSFV